MKIFYYPLFFRLRRFGEVPAIIAATMIVFILTWMLHSYQWFWIRGEFPITWQDGIFWMVLALLVVVGAVREFKRGRDRTLGSVEESWRGKTVRGLRTVCDFLLDLHPMVRLDERIDWNVGQHMGLSLAGNSEQRQRHAGTADRSGRGDLRFGHILRAGVERRKAHHPRWRYEPRSQHGRNARAPRHRAAARGAAVLFALWHQCRQRRCFGQVRRP